MHQTPASRNLGHLSDLGKIVANAVALGVVILLIPLRAAAGTETSPTEVGAHEEGISESDAGYDGSERAIRDRVWMNFYGIFYGSSIANPSKYQSSPYHEKDPNRPVLLKNFVTAGYDLSDRYAIAATGYFTYSPNTTQQFAMQDPSIRIANNSIFQLGGFNWYGDARVHFAVTDASKMNDLLVGFQSFHYFSYTFDDSRWSPGFYTSARYNVFGKLGTGNDLDLYFAPSLNYSVSDSVALTFLYELGASHSFGDNVGKLDNEGTDFQPGVLWRVTPGLEVNPYLNVYTGGRIALNTTSFGMTLSWMLL